MGNRPGWWRDSVFTTEEMDFMPQIPQPFGGLIKVLFGTAIQIEAFMDETDPHEHRLSLLSQQCYPREEEQDQKHDRQFPCYNGAERDPSMHESLRRD
jgi:hypothetical protein